MPRKVAFLGAHPDTWMRETLTLQFGAAANHVGSHFWNIQEELHRASANEFRDVVDVYDSDIVQQGAEAPVPRVLIYDVQSALSSLAAQQQQERAVDDGSLGLWSGDVTTVKREQSQRSAYRDDIRAANASRDADFADAFAQLRGEYEDAATGAAGAGAGAAEDADHHTYDYSGVEYPDDSEVQGWADYALADFASSSLVPVAAPPADAAVDSFSHGEQIARDDRDDELLTDPVRRAIEACDSMQAFHLLADVDTSFSGVASHVATYLHEECPKVTTLCVPISLAPGAPTAACELNRVLATAALLGAGTVMPLEAAALAAADASGPWRGDWRRRFHAAVPLAHALDAATSPYRSAPAGLREAGGPSAAQFWHPLSGSGDPTVVAADVMLPTAAHPAPTADARGRVSDMHLAHALRAGEPAWQSLLGSPPPTGALSSSPTASVVLRGALDPAAAVKAVHTHGVREWGMPSHRLRVWPHTTPLLVSPAAPALWPGRWDGRGRPRPGDDGAAEGRAPARRIASCAAALRLCAGERPAEWCRARVRASEGSDASRVLFHFCKAGLEKDDLIAAREALLEAAEAAADGDSA